jgi:predicted nucleic acid-binding protein
LLEDCVIIPFSQEIKHKSIKIRLSTRMKLIDSIIGASALTIGLSIITNDSDFSRLSNEIDIILIP